ncbi:MAG TPA: nucleotide pyrophosphohydrolase [Verrucomicrobiae bacterium]|nr:nucleotide pyrophosphohydrolase [Verrucomicrobiae bacterium]
MAISPLQSQVDEWASQFPVPYWQPLEILARLTEETGELARELNHQFGAKKKKKTEAAGDIGDEISDIFFTLICLANSQNISLDEAWERMMNKINNRDKDRFVKKETKAAEKPRHLW